MVELSEVSYYRYVELRPEVGTSEHGRIIAECRIGMAQCFHVSVFCWGNTANGELGVGGQEEMVVAEPRHLQTFQQAHHVRDGAVGRNHTALILDTGHVYTCGSNEMGQLGRQLGYSKFDLVGGLKLHHIRQVSTKGEHTLALSEAGQVFSWGCNLHGQLGYPTDSGQPSLEPRLIKKLALVHVVQVACGNSHSMALALGELVLQQLMGSCTPGVATRAGSLGWVGWSHRSPARSLSNCSMASPSASSQPGASTPSSSPPLELSLGGATTRRWIPCSVLLVLIAGAGRFGQLGINTDTNSWEPKLVFSLRSHYIHYVSCGENHTAALTKDGGVFTFGAGMYGQLGHGSRNNEILPRKVIELMGSTVTQIACGRCHTLAYVAHPPKLYAFGQGGNGQLGTGQFTNSTVPMAVRGPWSTARTSLQEDGPSSRKRSGSESRIHRRNFIYSSAPSPEY
ncbi:HERC4 [Cordylochernes scorpioides]|uniref:HERC4 n=1 Tax=Cordylochernes scorpioides TaxID=51811 RepID=A0ABY6LIQ9_9ARAC|nr:HERC4 [Cordylochernes scorpioides]